MHYIADFLCKELMLIVEVDGVTHDNEESLERDKLREKNLVKAGFKIVRFTDNEVLKNIAGVISELERLIDEMEKSTPLIPRQRGTRKKSEGEAPQ